MSSQKMMPLGFRFKPRIKTLISDYLKNKVKNQPLPCTDIIVEDQDLYADVPWNILKEKDPVEIEYPGGNIVRTFYVFTPVKKIGERYSRTVGDYGTWKGETGEKKVWGDCYNGDGRKEKIHIGFKRLLKFMASNRDGDESRNGEWIMHEYSLGGVSLGELEGYTLAKELVVCKVKQTIPKLANKRKLTTESNLQGETTKKTSDRVRPVVSNAISITSLNNVTSDYVGQVSDCVGQVNNNPIISFNEWTNERVTNQRQWPHASTSYNNRSYNNMSYNNRSYNNRTGGERVEQVINNMIPDFNNIGSDRVGNYLPNTVTTCDSGYVNPMTSNTITGLSNVISDAQPVNSNVIWTSDCVTNNLLNTNTTSDRGEEIRYAETIRSAPVVAEQDISLLSNEDIWQLKELLR